MLGLVLRNSAKRVIFARLATRRGGGVIPHSPADCDLAALPAVLMQASSSETLYSQICGMHELLEDAGAHVELQIWDKQVHVFQAARPLPEAQEAVARIAEYVDRAAPPYAADGVAILEHEASSAPITSTCSKRAGDPAGAREWFALAARRTTSVAEKRYLEAQAARLRSVGDSAELPGDRPG